MTHTNNQTTPWLEVDLGNLYKISLIRLWNRTDCCKDRLNGVNIWISDQPMGDNLSSAREFTGEFIQDFSPNLNPNAFTGLQQQARYVQVRLEGPNRILSLAELEVFGQLVP